MSVTFGISRDDSVNHRRREMMFTLYLALSLTLRDVPVQEALSKVCVSKNVMEGLHALKVNRAKLAEDHRGAAILFMKDESLVKIITETSHPGFWTDCRVEYFSDYENMCELFHEEDIRVFYSFVHEE